MQQKTEKIREERARGHELTDQAEHDGSHDVVAMQQALMDNKHSIMVESRKRAVRQRLKRVSAHRCVGQTCMGGAQTE